jgi:hypothetical protein
MFVYPTMKPTFAIFREFDKVGELIAKKLLRLKHFHEPAVQIVLQGKTDPAVEDE